MSVKQVFAIGPYLPLTATDIQEILQIQPLPKITNRFLFQDIGANGIFWALSRVTSKSHSLDLLPCLKF